MGSIGGAELVLVLVLALLLFGPRRLPQIGRTLGKAVSDLRKATADFKTNLEREVDLEQVKDLHGSIKSAGREVRDAVADFRDLDRPSTAGDRLPPRAPAEAPAPDAAPQAPSEQPSTDEQAGRERES